MEEKFCLVTEGIRTLKELNYAARQPRLQGMIFMKLSDNSYLPFSHSTFAAMVQPLLDKDIMTTVVWSRSKGQPKPRQWLKALPPDAMPELKLFFHRRYPRIVLLDGALVDLTNDNIRHMLQRAASTNYAVRVEFLLGDERLRELAGFEMGEEDRREASVLHSVDAIVAGRLVPQFDMLLNCAGCDEPNRGMKRCSRCKNARYCTVECQTTHWPIHKRTCRRV